MKVKVIVADAGPLIIYSKTVGIKVIGYVAEEILAPTAVIAECVGLKDKAGAQEIRNALAHGLLKEITGVSIAALPLDVSNILGHDVKKNLGEREAIALALLNQSAIILDDSEARKAAQIAGLQVVGSARILAEAYKAGAFTQSIEEILDSWEAHHFYLGAAVREKVIAISKTPDKK